VVSVQKDRRGRKRERRRKSPIESYEKKGSRSRRVLDVDGTRGEEQRGCRVGIFEGYR